MASERQMRRRVLDDLNEGDADEIIWNLTRVFGRRLPHIDYVIACYWLAAVETFGSVARASKAIGMDASTGWRYLKRTGIAAEYVDSIKRAGRVVEAEDDAADDR